MSAEQENMTELQKRVTKWLEEVLRNNGYENLNIEFPNFNTKGGYSGEVVYANVVVTNPNSTTDTLQLIIKRSKDGSVAQEELNLKIAYTNEVNLYSRIIPFMQQFAKERNVEPFENIPKCYGTINKNDDYVIVLENLKLKKFDLHDLTKPFDLAHIKLLMQSYAKWHALSFALKDQNPKMFIELIKDQKPMKSKLLDFFASSIKNEFEIVIENYKKKNESKDFIEKIKKLKEDSSTKIADFFRNVNEEKLVIRHGDNWNNNYLFRYNSVGIDPDKIVIIDWQLACPGSPMADIANALFSSCSRQELEHIDDILKLYHDTLSRRIQELGSDPKKLFPWETCVRSFQRFVPVALGNVPIMARMSYRIEKDDDNYDISETLKNENVSSLTQGELRDEEGYFERIDGVLKLCAEKNFI